ncbi:MAG TPA: nicotinamide-nucleotide amidohydrolase family protein [Treponemataceae bacterium]|nr:nicotinamide-nucleotide amidohydrolase family protein [Treponemataceae bacterium]HPS45150.1 nicotinamide-nucleotide amidohydrolase family protein [Treponemataceae bacterium]
MSAPFTLAARHLPAKVLSALKARGLTLATAESLTGGLIGASLTAVPGSSEAYWGGVVSYSVEAKVRLLGVPRETIERYGVVSLETASAMASGALEVSGADAAIAVTGVAGPSGGSPETPVGTVCIACRLRAGGMKSARVLIRGSRDYVRRKTRSIALTMVLDCLDRK